MTKNCFINILQNLHLTDNQTAEKSDKAYQMRIVINHLNKAFKMRCLTPKGNQLMSL